eukprot:scaffold113_cov339-Pavlova_lutheri.AAC.35
MKDIIHVSSAPQKAPYLLGTVIDSPTGPSAVLDESGSKGVLDVGILSCRSEADAESTYSHVEYCLRAMHKCGNRCMSISVLGTMAPLPPQQQV